MERVTRAGGKGWTSSSHGRVAGAFPNIESRLIVSATHSQTNKPQKCALPLSPLAK